MPRPVQFLKQRKWSEKKLKKELEQPLCSFDFETKGLGGDYLYGCFLTSDGVTFFADTLELAFDFILHHPQYRYLAHNASGYEFAYLYSSIQEWFEETVDAEIKATLQGDARFVQFLLTYMNGKKKVTIDIRDTLCLFNMKLADVAKAFTPTLPKGEPPWNKAHDNFNKNEQIWVDYLVRDCQIVLQAYQLLQKTVYDLFHCPLGITAGSTAMKGFQTCIPNDYIYFRTCAKKERFFRGAYYGAAVFPGHEIGNWGKVAGIDINGAYAFQMLKEYPVGAGVYTEYYQEGKLGIYEVEVTVPKHVYETLGFNPVPCRTKHGIEWKTGTFTTRLTSVEIEYARSKGIQITIESGYFWRRTERVFAPFVEKCQELELFENGKFKPTIKLFRNALYGKFGTKPVKTGIEFNKEKRFGMPITDIHTGFDIPYLWQTVEEVDASYIMPQWAAFITAYQRVYLFTFIEEAYRLGARNVYCDTDSLKTNYDIVQMMVYNGSVVVGKLYGQWKVEEDVENFWVVAPKAFYGETSTGEEVKKCKGIRNEAATKSVFMDALGNRRERIEFPSVQSLKQIIKGQRVKAVIRKRKLTDIQNSHSWALIGVQIYPRSWIET